MSLIRITSTASLKANALQRDGSKVTALEVRADGREMIPVAEPIELSEDVLIGLGEPPAPVDEVRYSFAGVFVCVNGKIRLFAQARHRKVEGGIIEVLTTDPVRIGTLMNDVESLPGELVLALLKPSPKTVWGEGKSRAIVANRPDPVLITMLAPE